jgi:urease accessory protein
MMMELASSFALGFVHPLHGADHLVAMVAVGVWGAIAGGRAIRVWPMAFVATMLVGFATAVLGIAVPFAEPAIWLSVVVLGLFVALAVNAPVWCGAALIGLFAFLHGHVHGTEAATSSLLHGTGAATSSLLAFASGLAIATGALHVAGIGLCRVGSSSTGRVALRTMGAVAAFGGILAMVGLT